VLSPIATLIHVDISHHVFFVNTNKYVAHDGIDVFAEKLYVLFVPSDVIVVIGVQFNFVVVLLHQ
jgi:hypothetical protein